MKRTTFLKKKVKILRRDNRFSQDSYRIYFIKSNKHFYASLIQNDTCDVIISLASYKVSSVEKSSRERISDLAKEFSAKISSQEYKGLFFDRGVYRYHGLLKHFVEEIRRHGIKV